MRTIVFVVVGLFALFTLIKAYTSVRAEGNKPSTVPVTVQPIMPLKP